MEHKYIKQKLNKYYMSMEVCLNSSMKEVENSAYHTLNDTWTLWAHLPHDTDWSIDSYKKIMDISNVEQVIELEKNVPDTMVKNCMIFCMRKNILPTWEDENNRNGGSFSFKIPNNEVYKTWNEVLMTLLTEMMLRDEIMNHNVNGITISPKKNFCILKIWLRTTDVQNVKLFNLPYNVDIKSTIFKKHNPEN